MKIRAFQTAQRAYKTTSGANLQLLEELGFDIAERYYNLLPKKSTKARVVFRKTLSLLRTVSEIIDDKTLENDVHSITEIQVSQLSKLHLGSIGYTRFKQLSSGAAALIDQFSGITLAVHQLSGKDRFKNLLLLIDEGDAFLHLSWQKRYVDYLDRMIENFKKHFDTIQVVVSTHSPVLMSDFPRQFIVNLKEERSIKSYIEKEYGHDQSTFGAPLETVMREIADTGAIGSFTARIIRLIAAKIEGGESVDPEQIEMIGDPAIRNTLASKSLKRAKAL